jgi:hypothetical protein
MSHEPSSDRKRKPVEEPDVAINSDDESPKKSNKACRVTFDASMTLSHIASLRGNAPMATESNATANNSSDSNNPEQEASMERIRDKIEDLSGSDNVEVNASLVALLMDLKKDPTTRDNDESTVSHEPSSDRKRKPVEEPDVTINSDDQSLKKCNKATRRMTLDSSMTLSHISSLQQNVPMVTERVATANNFFASNAHEQRSSMERIREKIRDLSGSDNVEINAALVALSLDLKNDPTTCDDTFSAGGCRALVHLFQNCLQKAIDEIPACDEVTKLNKHAELKTLHRALGVIIGLTFQLDESRVAIASIGGVEVVVKVMKTFPKCETLQECACIALRNLAYCSIGKTNAIESGGIKVLLAAINNHLLGSANVCKTACWALFNIVRGNKRTIELWISLDGRAAVSKVRSKWPESNEVYQRVLRQLTEQMTASQPTEKSSCKSSEVSIASLETPASSSLPTATKVATGSLSKGGATIEILDDSDDEDDPLGRENATQEPIAQPPVGTNEPLAGMDKPLAGKVPALSFQPTAAEDTTASPTVPNLSTPSTLIGIYHDSSNGASPSPKVPAVPSIPRNDNQLSEATPQVLSEQSRNDRKCKPTESREAVVANTASAITEDEEYIQSIGKMIQGLFHSDNTKVDTALYAMTMDLDKDTKNCDKIQAVGGCLAMVQLVKNCLEKAIDEIPACDQVTE